MVGRAFLSSSDMLCAGYPWDHLYRVHSLKIEGRQKNADYVYGGCRIYRRLLDERADARPKMRLHHGVAF